MNSIPVGQVPPRFGLYTKLVSQHVTALLPLHVPTTEAQIFQKYHPRQLALNFFLFFVIAAEIQIFQIFLPGHHVGNSANKLFLASDGHIVISHQLHSDSSPQTSSAFVSHDLQGA